MTDRTNFRGRPKRDRRIIVREVPTDTRDLRKLARAFIALARGLHTPADASKQSGERTDEGVQP